MKKILFIVAHPDDAELAAGGTIKKFTASGSVVKVVNLTVSENTDDTRKLRMAAAARAAAILGYEPEWYNNGLYNQVEEIRVSELVKGIDSIITDFNPSAIFTHWDGDSHYDHILTYKAVIASTRKNPHAALYCLPPNELRTIRFTEFSPNTFVDISDHIDSKLQAIAEYNSFTGNIFRPLQTENYKTVSRYFGITSGYDFAEAFLMKKQTGILF